MTLKIIHVYYTKKKTSVTMTKKKSIINPYAFKFKIVDRDKI